MIADQNLRLTQPSHCHTGRNFQISFRVRYLLTMKRLAQANTAFEPDPNIYSSLTLAIVANAISFFSQITPTHL